MSPKRVYDYETLGQEAQAEILFRAAPRDDRN